MTPPGPAPLPTPLRRLQLCAASLLGPRYAAVVSILDRALSAFALAFAAKALGSGFNVAGITSLSYWQTAGYAGLLAAVSVVKSAIMTRTTGDPALLSPVSKTLRARRDTGYRVEYHVPVRPVTRPDAAHRPSPRRPRPTPEGPIT